MARIVTLMPTRGIMYTKTMNAWLRELAKNGQLPAFFTTDNLPIPECRNALVEEGLKVKEATHFLLLDDDVIMPENGLKAMIDLDADIAFIDYPMHYSIGKWKNMGTACHDNWLPGQKWDKKPVKWAGLGCVLVKREVFEKIANPWFESMHKSFERDDDGKISFTGEMPTGDTGGEDCYFYQQALKQKMNIKKVTNMTAGHARIEKFVYHLQSGKYATQHKIKVNDKIDQPYR